MFNIKPIKKRNISEEVFEQIKDNIVKQVWPSGSKLPSENHLAEIFQVSRVSIRTAIHKLTALGILESRNGEGTFVKQLNAGVYLNSLIPTLVLAPYDILQLLEFRRGLEMLSCELAAQRATDEDIKVLQQIVDNMKKSYSEKDIAQYSVEDFNFHICISKISKNSVIENVLMILKDPVFTHLSEMNNMFDPNLTTELHYKIFEAIKDRDPKAASFYIEESIKISMEKIKKYYELK